MLLLIRSKFVTEVCINVTSQSCATKGPFNISNVAVTRIAYLYRPTVANGRLHFLRFCLIIWQETVTVRPVSQHHFANHARESRNGGRG